MSNVIVETGVDMPAKNQPIGRSLYEVESLRKRLSADVETFLQNGGEVKVYNDKGVQTATRKLVDGELITTPYIGTAKAKKGGKKGA